MAPKEENKMGRWGATAYVIGNIVGSGIFISPTSITNLCGSVGILSKIIKNEYFHNLNYFIINPLNKITRDKIIIDKIINIFISYLYCSLQHFSILILHFLE